MDWNADLPDGEKLVSVIHTVPAQFEKVSEQVDADNGLSTVRVSGGQHGDVEEVTALATITTGERIPGAFTLRVMRGT
jgi:hypothetical protein